VSREEIRDVRERLGPKIFAVARARVQALFLGDFAHRRPVMPNDVIFRLVNLGELRVTILDHDADCVGLRAPHAGLSVAVRSDCEDGLRSVDLDPLEVAALVDVVSKWLSGFGL
jgi:hypothetical protein